MVPAFEEHMEPPPKKAVPTYEKILHAWSVRFLYIVLRGGSPRYYQFSHGKLVTTMIANHYIEIDLMVNAFDLGIYNV